MQFLKIIFYYKTLFIITLIIIYINNIKKFIKELFCKHKIITF